MRRGPLIAAVAVVVLTALLAVVTNWATEIVAVPAWLADPRVIVLVGVVLVLLLVVAALVGGRAPDNPYAPAEFPTFATVAPSLRPPPPGPVFGRDAELAALAVPNHEPLLDVVCAGGGTGKTTLAREVARRHGQHAFWIDWRNDPDVLATSMVEVARTLGLPQEKVTQTQRSGASLPDLVWTHLESVRGWLVVVDNVDDVDSLQTGAIRISTYRGWLRPTAAGRLLITTRLQDAELWGPQARLHRIGRLPTADAAAVLRDYAPHGGDAAEDLAERLGGHPLALRAAGRAVGASTSAWPTFAAYLAALREHRISVLPDAPRATHPETARRLVGHTWEVSLDQLVAKPETRLARPLLRALSLLAQAPIPRGLITPALLPDEATEQQVDAALDGLNRYGLLEPAAAPGTVLLHPLVRETSAAFLARETKIDEWRSRVEDRVVRFAEETVSREREGWNVARLLVPHMFGLSGLDLSDDEADMRFRAARDALVDVAEQLQAAGAGALLMELRQRVFDTNLRRTGPESLDVLVSRIWLAHALLIVGNPAGAARECRIAVDSARRCHPEQIPEARSELAFALVELGACDEALEHLEEVHDVVAARDGPEHLSTLNATHNLASALSECGSHWRALDLLRDNLAIGTRLYGVDHTFTRSAIHQIALTLHRLRRYREAEELDAGNLAWAERVLGDQHPYTLASRHNLAQNRCELGTHADAADLARQTLVMRERILGVDHPDTMITRQLLEKCEQALRASSHIGRLRALLRR